MTTSTLARVTVFVVAAVGIAAALTSDGNARGAAALAARCAMRGADDEAMRWLERCRATLRRRGCDMDAFGIADANEHAFERVLEFDVRDDAARAWWRQQAQARTQSTSQPRGRRFFEKPLRPGR